MPTTLNNLIASYKEQMVVMASKELTDEERQRILLKLIPVQLRYLLKLILGIFLFISPFLLLLIIDSYILTIGADTLYYWDGILVSVVAVVLYITFKKNYGRIFKSRKNTS